MLNLTAAGCSTLTSWINDPAANHGMVVLVTGTGNWRVATREHSGTLGTPGPYAPLLTLEVGLQGDINGDGYVNVSDLQALVAAWGSQKTPPSANWNADADLNSDDFVNVGDLQLLVAHWGESQ